MKALALPFSFRADKSIRAIATAMILAAAMSMSACWFKASWLATAESDLPILIQMATSIVSIISLTKTGTPPSAQEINTIQNISTIASQGLQAIDALYKSYNGANATTTIEAIKAAGTALTGNLTALLASAQIKDPALLARLTAAVNLIVSTLGLFLGLIPSAKLSRKDLKKITYGLPHPKDLRQQWATQVGTPLLN